MSEPMSGPMYVPALPARPSGLAAYGALTPDVRAVVTPLWTVPPHVGGARTREKGAPHRPDPDPLAPVGHLRTALHRMVGVQCGRPAWVDARHAEGEPRHLLAEFRSLLARTPLRPVTGVERDVRQQEASAEVARASGNGLGLRVPPEALLHGRLRDAVGSLLERIAFARCPVDLLLDLGAVDEDHRGPCRTALRALNALAPLHPWRTVVLLSGAFPRTHPRGYGAPLAETYRTDRFLPDLLRRAVGRHGTHPVHGDYGAHDPTSADRVSDTGRVPFRGALRYTTARTFLVGEVPAGTDHHVTVRRLAREIVGSPDFRGAGYSAGDRWLSACADGSGPLGTGHPDAWICAGHAQHLTHVARELRRHS
ncbi:hypothetical protein ACFW2Y_14205 [Streptomyces sp. NPDC058877]|uniref:beta family protein n=1 Tax=unclassified Streptomyces TaxID=2593676 RepID=UPI0036A36015